MALVLTWATMAISNSEYTVHSHSPFELFSEGSPGLLWLDIVQIQRNGQVSWCQANALVTAGLYPYRYV